MVVKIFEHFLRTISVCTVSTLYVLFHLILQNLYESVGIFNLIFQMRIVSHWSKKHVSRKVTELGAVNLNPKPLSVFHKNMDPFISSDTNLNSSLLPSLYN